MSAYTPDPSPTIRVLVPLPDRDFDPTEISIPWQILNRRGIEVVFATEGGLPAVADPYALTGIVFGRLGATQKAKDAYQLMTETYAFRQPLRWADVDAAEYDALLLPGGHAPGMRQYLGSEQVREIVLAMWQRQIPVGAICHGVLLLARTIDPATDKSLLDGRHVTTIPASMETMFTRMVTWRRGHDYAHTYPELVETEVRNALGPNGTYEPGHGRKTPFVVTDERLTTARFPGDTKLFGTTFADELQHTHTVEVVSAA